MRRLSRGIAGVLGVAALAAAVVFLAVLNAVAGLVGGLVALAVLRLGVAVMTEDVEPGPGADARKALREHLSEIAARLSLDVETADDIWKLVLPGRGRFTSTVTVPLNCFEWFVDVTVERTGDEVWSDWCDHYGQPEEALVTEEIDSIGAYVESWCSADAVRSIATAPRLVKEKPVLKWRHDGTWSAVTL